MKVIPLSEAKAKLGHYGRLCQDEPIVVTVNGVPAFQLAPLDDDDLIDRLMAYNPEFRRMLETRADEPTVSMEAALERL
jgi:prevent-host-death family protein